MRVDRLFAIVNHLLNHGTASAAKLMTRVNRFLFPGFVLRIIIHTPYAKNTPSISIYKKKEDVKQNSRANTGWCANGLWRPTTEKRRCNTASGVNCL